MQLREQNYRAFRSIAYRGLRRLHKVTLGSHRYRYRGATLFVLINSYHAHAVLIFVLMPRSCSCSCLARVFFSPILI